MKIHEKIKSFRVLKGLSQLQMANSLSISQTGYSKIEKGKSDINLSQAILISKTLDVSFNELFEIDAPSVSVDHLIKNNELLLSQIEELEHKISYQEKMIERYEKQVDFLNSYFYAYRAAADSAKEIVLQIILVYEQYLKEAKLPKIIPISLVSANVRKEAIRLLKQYFVIDEKQFEETFLLYKQKIDELK